MGIRNILCTSFVAATVLGLSSTGSLWAQQPRAGGTLVFTIPASDAPSFDAHQEETFALIHAAAPEYNLLIRIDPTDPAAKRFEGDVAESWRLSPDKTVYTFKLRRNVKFHDGSAMTAKDVVASFQHMINPPPVVISPRRPYFSMIDTVSAPDDYTVVFKLKFPSGAFLGVAAMPFNWIYKAEILAKDPNWYKTHVMGTGPFMLKEQNPGANWVGVRNPDYFREGLPLLDGYEGIYTPKEVVEIQNLRSGRSMIQFRGFPPAARDLLKQDLGDKIRVQETSWNCGLYATPNSSKQPFADVRFRRALSLALDRWGGSEALSKIAIVKTVGGYVFPGHELAMSQDEIARELLGYGRNVAANRTEAKRLLKEAGVPEGFRFKFINRNTEQPYKIVGTWLVDQWRQIGLNVEQVMYPTGPWIAEQRKRPSEYDVIMDTNCQNIVNPQVDLSRFMSDDRTDGNFSHYIDRKIDTLFDAQMREPEPAKQKQILKELQIYLASQAYHIHTFWWQRTVLSHVKVRDWYSSPSHYINNQLETVWLAE